LISDHSKIKTTSTKNINVLWDERDRSITDYWFGLLKSTASVFSTTYWLDGNPSTYRWWASGEPNEDFRCIQYSYFGFMDTACKYALQYTCKMPAGTNLSHLVA